MRLIPTRAAWLAPVVFCCAVGPQLAAAHIPIPPRAPSPYVGPEPWPGFRPWTEGARDLPLEPAARWDRWRAYRQGAVPSLDHRMRAATPAPEVTRSPRQESRQFQEGFEAALAAARDNRVEETLQRVRDLQPETLAGIERVRRLWFAAAVAGSEMAMAESLFYRLSWDDGGRTATRLAAWRELASGSGARAAELLSGLGARTPGEHVAAGIGRWMQSAASVGNLPDAPGDAPTPRAGWTLLAAQERLLAGDRAGAAALLDEAPDMAPAWASVRDELRELASGQDRNLSGADRLLVESLSRKFEAAAWPQVVDESGSWLAAWPASPWRPQVVYMRGMARLALGDATGARDDFTAAGRDRSLATRADLGRIFATALSEPDPALAQLSNGAPGSERLGEPERLFHQIRIARAAGRSERAELALLRLEEGYPDSEWLPRARADLDPAAWKTPWITALPEPAGRLEVAAPSGGPWGRLLWGDSLLAETARVLEQPILAGAERGTGVAARAAESVLPGPRSAHAPRWNAAMRGGSPIALQFELGVGGLFHDLHYQAAGHQTFAEPRNGLPRSERTDWELGLGATPGDHSLGVVAEFNRREEGPAGALGLVPDAVSAGWTGARADFALGDPEVPGFAGAVSWVRGDLDAGRLGSWTTDQLWLHTRGEAAAMDRPLAVEATAGWIDYHEPRADRQRTYVDLKTTLHSDRGWFAGLRASAYDRQALIMPVLGMEHQTEDIRLWAISDPTLTIPAFRSVFVVNGDWNVPDWGLGGVRRPLHLELGAAWELGESAAFQVSTEGARISQLRTWTRDAQVFREVAAAKATEVRTRAAASWRPGPLDLGVDALWQRVRTDGGRVPYLAAHTLRVSGAYRLGRLTLGGTGNRVSGRITEAGAAYGDFWRWDADLAYRLGSSGLPLGARWLEVNLRVENLFDAADVRWPGVPGYGRGVYAGIRLAESD